MLKNQEIAPRKRMPHLWRIAPPLAIMIAILFIIIIMIIPFAFGEFDKSNHYLFQAQSWLKGTITIDNAPVPLNDVVIVNGHKYLSLGPFPAVLMLPFVAIFGAGFNQLFLVYILIGLSGFTARRILLKLNVTSSATRRCLLALFFLGTVYFSVLMGGAYLLAHVVTCFFLFLSIDESLGQRRAPLLGLYLGLAAITRVSALFTFPFAVMLLMLDKPDPLAETGWQFAPWRNIITRFMLFGVGAVIPLGIYAFYNYVRFGSFFDTGYGSSVLGGVPGVFEQARATGLFNLAHIPKKLYYFLLAMPEPYGTSPSGNPADSPVLKFPYIVPSAWGMSILLTTPAVIYCVKAGFKRSIVCAAWAAIILTAIPIFMYYGIGYYQYGYRYALDFTPFLWLLIVIALKDRYLSIRKPSLAFWIIVAGIAFNIWSLFAFIMFNPR